MRTSYLMLGSVINCKFKLSLMIDINYNICVTNMFSVLNALALRDSSSYERKLKSEKMCRNQSYFLTMKLICRKKSFSVVENCSKYRVRLLNCDNGPTNRQTLWVSTFDKQRPFCKVSKMYNENFSRLARVPQRK